MCQFLTQREAAEFLKISDETLKRYKQRGSLIRWLKGENSMNILSTVDRILATI